MADSLADLSISNTVWENIDTLTGLAAGTEVLIQNKSSYPVLLFLQVSQPSADSIDGEVLLPGKNITLGSAQNDIWAKSLGAGPALINVRDL